MARPKLQPAASAFYAGFPYSARLAMAVEESEHFLTTPAFLEAPTAEAAMQRHIENDAGLADCYGLEPDAIWRAASTIDLDARACIALAVILVTLGSAARLMHSASTPSCQITLPGRIGFQDSGDWGGSEPTD
jgi:hypothetical protein